MKQWTSKWRAQRLRERLKDAGAQTPRQLRERPNQALLRLGLGFAVWLTTCALWYTGAGDEVHGLDWALTMVRRELMLLIGTLVAAAFLKVLAPSLFFSNSRLLLLAFCGLAGIIPAEVILHAHSGPMPWVPSAITPFAIPFTFPPLLAGILLGAAGATITGIWVSYVCTILYGNNLAVLMTGLIATAVSASLAPQVRRRTEVIRIGLLTGIGQIVGMLAWLEDPISGGPLIKGVLACLMSGLGSALIVVTVLPLLEKVFGITTDITLMELSDLGQPLLQRLAFEAPGTYHHSLMVANLAQAAADAIGANPILARVGAYFHDIGKLTKPSLFAENIQGPENPHHSLAPSMSALLVMAHVKEGLSLALLHRLPQAVMDVIQQHHGTGLVAYFHHKAGQQAEAAMQDPAGRISTVTVDPTPYRYPGPRPLSREAVIIMLADAVEAASRSLEKPTPAHVGELVSRLVDKRFEDEQLDESQMTLAELARVKQAFVLCLSSMLHTRIAYPK